jgi:thiol-disulfide isomerase/thioredoxin
MNTVAVLRLLAISSLLVVAGGCGREENTSVAEHCAAPAAPPAAVATVDAVLTQRGGEWLVVNYWAEWCKPCLEEIPQLNAFARAHDRVRVLMVNYDGVTGEQLRAQAARLGIATAVVESDPAPQLGIGRPQVLPTTYVVGPDGKLHDTLIGPQTVASLDAAIGC